MPVMRLLVEGDLDQQLLQNVLSGNPTVVATKGSKNSLGPMTREDRKKSRNLNICYLRDRDFDYDPPETQHGPIVDDHDQDHEGSVLGWRWCRHEIENYMLEPSIVRAVTGISIDGYITAMHEAAHKIRFYQSARWTIGIARRELQPPHKFKTRPIQAKKKEHYLPDDLSENFSWDWVDSTSESFSERVSSALNRTTLRSHFEKMLDNYNSNIQNSFGNILLWFSGKDLFKGLEPWISIKGYKNSGEFCSSLRDWFQDHPDDVLDLLPEWKSFVNYLRR